MQLAPSSDDIQNLYRHVHTLLGEEPQQSAQAHIQLAHLESQLGLRLPVALQLWFRFAAMEACMHKLALSHTPIPLGELSVDYTDLNPRYARTAPSPSMLPVLFENQGVWHMAVPINGQADPPVYMGYQEDNLFEWHIHARRFTDFIYAWTWDYLPYDSGLGWWSTRITIQEMEQLRSVCTRGPTNYRTNGVFNYERFERYASGNHRLTLVPHSTQPWVFATEQTGAYLEVLLRRPTVG